MAIIHFFGCYSKKALKINFLDKDLTIVVKQ